MRPAGVRCLLLALAVLAGCAVSGAGHRVGDPAALLRYASELEELPAPELARRRQALERAYARGTGAGDRLRLALLLGEPRTPGGNVPRAQRLLAEHTGDPAQGGGSRDLARLLSKLLRERTAAEAQRQSAEQAIHAQLARIRELERVLDALRADVAREREQRRALAIQVEALKAIEHQINRRARPSLEPKTPE